VKQANHSILRKTAAFALAGVMALSLAACTGKTKSADTGTIKTSGQTPSSSNTVPTDATSAYEEVANAFIDSLSALYDQAAEYSSDGLSEIADYLYGTTAASTSAMRYAVDCLLYMKGEGATLDEVIGGRMNDWGSIAALGFASPYPYIFEGFVDEADGRTDAANDCYDKAIINPNVLEHSEYLKAITLLDVPALKRVKEKLTSLEDKIFAVYAPPDFFIPRNENNFNDAWLRAQGREILNNDSNNYEAALLYYIEAVKVNPYNGDNYAGCATLYIFMDDPASAIRYVNDGLFIDPQSKSLNTILGVLEGAAKE